MDILVSLGESAGHQRLLATLGRSESTYEHIKPQLLDEGRIRAGRGRGGSVVLAAAASAVPAQALVSTPDQPLTSALPRPISGLAPAPELDCAGSLWKAADKLHVMASKLLTSLRANVTVDWVYRESVKAKLRVLVKRILRKYGYPPDLQDAAVQTVAAGRGVAVAMERAVSSTITALVRR